MTSYIAWLRDGTVAEQRLALAMEDDLDPLDDLEHRDRLSEYAPANVIPFPSKPGPSSPAAA